MKDLEMILLKDNVVENIEENLKYLTEIIPEIEYMFNFPHNHPHHHLDVWNHTLLALSNSPNKFEIRLTLLLHDIGKPFSYQDLEVRHFWGHPEVSKNMSELVLSRLGYNNKFSDYILKLIEEHDTLIDIIKIQDDINFYNDLFLVQYCDALAHHPEKLDKRIKYLECVYSLLKEYQPNGILKDINIEKQKKLSKINSN